MAITATTVGQGANSATPTFSFGFTASAGDLIVFAVAQDGAGTVTWPGSWVELLDQAGTGFTAHVAYLIASGGETSVSPTSTVSERWEGVFWLIPAGEWHGTTAPEIGTAATGSSTTPDPPSISPSWGSETNNIFIALAFRDDSAANTITAYPTNYGTAQADKNDVTSAANTGGAVRLNTTATEDPGTFTISASETWLAETVAVRPASSGLSVSPGLVSMTLTPVAPAGVHQQVTPGLISMALTPVAPAGIAQSVAPGLISMALTPVAPTQVAQSVAPSLVSMALTPVAPQIIAAQFIQTPLVGMTLTPVAPSVNQQVQAALVSMALTPIAPTQVAQRVTPGLVSMALTPVSPQVNQQVQMQLVSMALTAIAPTDFVFGGGPQSVTPGLVDMALTPVAPAGINQQVQASLVSMLLTPIAPTQVAQSVSPGLVSMLLTPVAPVVRGAVTPPLINMLLSPLAPVIAQVGAVTMRRMHDIQYHAVIYNPDSQGGPGTPKMELDPDALNLVWQQALNYPAMAAIGMARFNDKLADIAYMQDHIKIFREDSKGLKTVFSGKAVKPDETARDSLVYFWDYTAFLQRSRTGFRVLYPDKFIDEIVTAEWGLAKAADKSPFEFVTTGTIERPLGLDGTTPIKVNSQFGVINFDRLFTFFALAELSMANTSNTVVFEITREPPHTFNFWKNRSTQRTSYHFTFPGNLIDYSLEDGHSEIVNDISTPILDPTTGAQVEYALTDTASKDTYRRLQAAVAIKTLFGINAGTTETDQQKAALARLLSISATVPSLYTLFPRQGEITPFDGWDLGDTIRTTILNPKKTGDATDSYKRITGIAGAWSPAGGELLQLSVR